MAGSVLVPYEISSTSSDSDGETAPANPTKRSRCSQSQGSPTQPFSTEAVAVRRFPHVDGNWASHIFLRVPTDDDLGEEMQRPLAAAVQRWLGRTVALLSPPAELHLSLSRTFTLLGHEIEPLVEALRTEMARVAAPKFELGQLDVFENEDCTRAFLVARCGVGPELSKLVQGVNRAVRRFGRPPYYDNGHMHVSLLSWVPNRVSALTEVHSDKGIVPNSSIAGVSNDASAKAIAHDLVRSAVVLPVSKQREVLPAEALSSLNETFTLLKEDAGLDREFCLREILVRAGHKEFSIPLLQKG